MKISRVKASTVEVKAAEELQPEVKLPCKYDSAIELVKGAIDALGPIAKDDIVAKESIINLSVILMDLKGSC